MERQFHFTNGALKQMLRMRSEANALVERVEALNQFDYGLDYVRTYSQGSETEWKTIISQDLPVSDNMLIATVYRYKDGEWKHFITMGMLWDGKAWSFHS